MIVYMQLATLVLLQQSDTELLDFFAFSTLLSLCLCSSITF